MTGSVKVKANGISIEVEDTGADGSQAARPMVLSIMGLGMQLVAWPPSGSPGFPLDEAALRERVLLAARRSFHPAGTVRQMAWP